MLAEQARSLAQEMHNQMHNRYVLVIVKTMPFLNTQKRTSGYRRGIAPGSARAAAATSRGIV
jgi:hypothetical protein